MNCDCDGGYFADIYLITAKWNNIENTIVHDSEFIGIQVEDSDSNTITSCELYNNIPTGLRLRSSADCVISNCYIHHNTQWGIVLVATSNNNEFHDCVIDSNPNEGFYIYTGEESPSVSNIIYRNNLVFNNPNAVDQGTNEWSHNDEGNFWSDYTGVDDNHDGIGDIPYSIPGENNQDSYPLMIPTQNVRPNIPDKPWGIHEGKTGRTYRYFTKTVDFNGDNVYYIWDWGDGTISDWLGPYPSDATRSATHSWNNNGNYNIKVKAKDTSGLESKWSDPLPVTMPLIYIGNTNLGSNCQSIEDQISGSYFAMPYNGNADYINAYIQTIPGTSPMTICMIYNGGTFIGSTEEKIINTGGEGSWITYNFSDPKPTLQANTEYTLVCWSNDTCNLAYNTTTNSIGRYKNQVYSIPPPRGITWDSNQQRNYSIYCSYSPIPEIGNIAASPNPIGFGYSTTITAIVEHYIIPIYTVNVSITYPSTIIKNFTMTQINDDTYQCIFNDSWFPGRYNYSIWVTDDFGTTCSSRNHSFNITAQATISISTLKDSYSGTQYINLTDPPNPPNNLTIINRGLTWNNYYNATSGCNELEVSICPVNYQTNNGTWTPINNSFYQLPSDHPAFNYGYRVGNDHGLFGVYFKPNAQDNWPVAFTYNKSNDPTTYGVRSKLVGIGYLDPQSNWAYQYLQNAQSSQGQTNGDTVTYQSVFTGTDVTWSYKNTELKEEIILSNATKTVLQNHPPSQYGLHDASSYLVFITKLDYQNLDMYNTSGLLTGNVTITDKGVDFKDILGYFKCALPLGEAYQLNNDSVYQTITYRIVHLNGSTYLLSGLKVSKLNAMTFPVVIDPTLSVNSVTNDGYIYNRNTNYNTAWTASTGTISSTANYISIGQDKVATIPSNYDIYRGFFLFDTSSLPSNAIIDNAKLQVYKKDDYSTTDFTITIQNGQPTYPHNPLQTSDYAKSHYSGNGGGLNTSRFVNGLNLIGLTNLNWINRTGMTKLCLRSFKEINGTTPTGNEYVNVYSAEASGNYVPKLIIVYRNQSKIKNTGPTAIKGYLLIQVQYYNSAQGTWIVDKDTINETSPRTLSSSTGSQLALDTIFNGHVRASDLTHGTGTYRVYTAFRDPNGNVLKTSSGVELKAWWQFNKT